MIVLHFPFRLISKDNERTQRRNGGYYLSQKYRSFEDAIAIYAKNQYKGKILIGDLNILVRVYFINKKHSDATNLFKGVCDALQGIIYKNDRQIKQATIEIHYFTEDAFRVLIQEIETVEPKKSTIP
jgi:Holliday junction resolvase RusA-like endonuclease